MKTIMLWCALTVISSVAFARSPENAYLAAINGISDSCRQIAIADWAAGEPQFLDAPKNVQACIDDAALKGQQVYKGFMKQAHSAQIKADARAVYIAWVSWLPSSYLDDDQQGDYVLAERSTFLHAEMALQADALTQ